MSKQKTVDVLGVPRTQAEVDTMWAEAEAAFIEDHRRHFTGTEEQFQEHLTRVLARTDMPCALAQRAVTAERSRQLGMSQEEIHEQIEQQFREERAPLERAFREREGRDAVAIG